MKNSERQVADFLKILGMPWRYQSPVFVYDEKTDKECGHLTFTFQNLGYIDVCGSENFDYAYREKIFEKNSFPVIFVHSYKEKDKWKAHLTNRIKEIEEQRHFEAMKMMESLLAKDAST